MEIPGSGEQYNLKWNNHLANFVQTFIEHQLEEALVDVTLSCEGQFIKTHKLILSACSEYFHNLFQLHGNNQYPIIVLNGVRFNDLNYILHFIYHGEVKVLDKDLANVLALGETLQIKGLSSVKLREMTDGEDPRTQKEETQVKENISNNSKPTSSGSSERIPVNGNKKPVFDYSKKKAPNVLTKQNSSNAPLEVTNSIVKPLNLISEMPSGSSNNQESNKNSNKSITSKDITTPVPKSPHAFMIFANEWRGKLTVEHPEESNKEISVRLGNMWKNLLPETKNIYYREAKRVEEEHMLKYPNYDDSKDKLKRKADTLNDSMNKSRSIPALKGTSIRSIQNQVYISDSD
ncbi:hypothetical protein ABEB36_005138 [Hypothenemus hampei]|uniref:Uncharacterized protein n=1 Tax=Hypothenemus hampei TaxID=57062 RepID=A0ABD1EX55_HYPHA